VADTSGPALAAATLDLLDHLDRFDPRAIAADCRDRFSVDAVTRRYEAVLWAVAGRRPRALGAH